MHAVAYRVVHRDSNAHEAPQQPTKRPAWPAVRVCRAGTARTVVLLGLGGHAVGDEQQEADHDDDVQQGLAEAAAVERRRQEACARVPAPKTVSSVSRWCPRMIYTT